MGELTHHFGIPAKVVSGPLTEARERTKLRNKQRRCHPEGGQCLFAFCRGS